MNRRTQGPTTGSPAEKPWWRVGMMWLVVGGPALVVVAGITTAIIAMSGDDVVLTEGATAASRPGAQAPAIQGRNHAATPGR